jgi:hypothetical protein
MVTPMSKKEKEKKEPLDMTTEEMAEYLFPKKVHNHLKEVARGKEVPPPSDENGSKSDKSLPQKR